MSQPVAASEIIVCEEAIQETTGLKETTAGLRNIDTTCFIFSEEA